MPARTRRQVSTRSDGLRGGQAIPGRRDRGGSRRSIPNSPTKHETAGLWIGVHHDARDRNEGDQREELDEALRRQRAEAMAWRAGPGGDPIEMVAREPRAAAASSTPRLRRGAAHPSAGVVKGESEECGEKQLHGQRTRVRPEIVPGCLDVGADQAGRTRQLTAQGGREFISPERCAIGNQERGAPCGRGLLKPSERGLLPSRVARPRDRRASPPGRAMRAAAPASPG